jgi:hypothetical protein
VLYLGSFWAANEYATSSTSQLANWGTAIAHFQIGNPVPPPVLTVPTANPNPVTGTSTTLSVTATDPNPGAALSYTWSVFSGPTGVTFSSNNGTTTGNSVTAMFTQAGTYVFQVTASDQFGGSASSTVQVTVLQTLTKVTVSPSSVTLNNGQSQQFTATGYDQFGKAISGVSFTWSLSSSLGTLSSTTGSTVKYTAPSSATGTVTLTATGSYYNGVVTSTVSGPATVTVRRKRH